MVVVVVVVLWWWWWWAKKKKEEEDTPPAKRPPAQSVLLAVAAAGHGGAVNCPVCFKHFSAGISSLLIHDGIKHKSKNALSVPGGYYCSECDLHIDGIHAQIHREHHAAKELVVVDSDHDIPLSGGSAFVDPFEQFAQRTTIDAIRRTVALSSDEPDYVRQNTIRAAGTVFRNHRVTHRLAKDFLALCHNKELDMGTLDKTLKSVLKKFDALVEKEANIICLDDDVQSAELSFVLNNVTVDGTFYYYNFDVAFETLVTGTPLNETFVLEGVELVNAAGERVVREVHTAAAWHRHEKALRQRYGRLMVLGGPTFLPLPSFLPSFSSFMSLPLSVLSFSIEVLCMTVHLYLPFHAFVPLLSVGSLTLLD